MTTSGNDGGAEVRRPNRFMKWLEVVSPLVTGVLLSRAAYSTVDGNFGLALAVIVALAAAACSWGSYVFSQRLFAEAPTAEFRPHGPPGRGRDRRPD